MENGTELKGENRNNLNETELAEGQDIDTDPAVDVVQTLAKEEVSWHPANNPIKGYRLNSTISMDTVSIRSTTSPDVLLREQASKLFSLCDSQRKGFVVKMDLDSLNDFFTPSEIEHLGIQIDESEQKYFDEAKFITAIEPLLLHRSAEVSESEARLPALFSTGECSLSDELAVCGMGNEKIPNRNQNCYGAERDQVVQEGHPFDINAQTRNIETVSSAQEENHKKESDSNAIPMYISPIIQKEQFRPIMPDPYDENEYFQPPQSLAHELSEVENGVGPSSTQIPPELDLRAPDRIFKVVFVGDSAVGKTCFLHRFCYNRFKPLFNATIGVDFTVKTIQLRDRLIAVQLWDTAGQERFRSITKQYFRKADGVVLMYDVTSEQSFLHVRNWIDSVRAGVDDNVVMCLVGNKVDLFASEETRSLTYRAGRRLAEEFGILFFETSAFTGYGIQECMISMASRLQQREEDHLEEALKLEMMVNEKKRSWCCL